ncbi:MAG: hypothetical protein LBD23_03315 [Oscillospiraceae bacterium]|jgi:hypothetical protein|nr:hypothetical protein [Oscillospiraceae bacterium]
MINNDFYRAFGTRFLVSTLLVAITMVADSGQDFLQMSKGEFIPHDGTTVLYYYLYPVSFGGVFSRHFIALLAGLPFAIGYIDEYKMFPYIVYKSGASKYCFSKMVTCAISGGIAVASGRLLFISILMIKFPLVSEFILLEYEWMPYSILLTHNGGVFFVLLHLLLSFLTGFFWGAIAMCVSVFFPNKLVVTTSPFIFSFTLTQLYRLTRMPDELRLDRLLTGRGWNGSVSATLINTIIMVFTLFGLCSFLFSKYLRKKRL